MNFPPALRLALVPIGVAIAHKGLSYLSDESDRLAAQIDAARAELAAAHLGDEQQPAPDSPDPDEDGPDPDEQAATSRTATPAPRRRSRLASILGNAAAFGAGAYLAMRAQAFLQQRAAAELLHDIGTTPAAEKGTDGSPCHDCGKPVNPEVTFPGPRCVNCWTGE